MYRGRLKRAKKDINSVKPFKLIRRFLEEVKRASEDEAKAKKSLVLVSVEVDYSDMTRRKARLKRWRASVIE